jgi:hypothetical protein
VAARCAAISSGSSVERALQLPWLPIVGVHFILELHPDSWRRSVIRNYLAHMLILIFKPRPFYDMR